MGEEILYEEILTVQKGLDARQRKDRAAERTLGVREQREPKRIRHSPDLLCRCLPGACREPSRTLLGYCNNQLESFDYVLNLPTGYKL